MKHARYEEHAAGLAQKMSDYFIALRRQARRHRVTVVSVMCVVVFATTYALILPAVTIDKNTASNEPGMSVEAATDAADSNAETISSDQQAAGSLISEPTTMEYKGEDYKVEAAVDADAQLPEGTTLKAQEVTEASDPEAYASYSQKALEQAKEKDSSVQSLSSARFFDISFVKADGSEMEPSADVAITLNYDDTQEVSDASKVSVVHIADDGAASAVDPEKVDVDAPDGKLSSVEFKASSFSIYAIVDTGDTTKTKEYRRTYTFQNDDGSAYTFTLNKNPESGSNQETSQQIVKNGESLKDVGVPTPKVSGYEGQEFLGWGVVTGETVDTDNLITDLTSVTVSGLTADETVTLRAVFANQITITFHDETGATIQKKKVNKGTKADISDVTTEGTGDVALAGWTTTKTLRTQNADGSFTSNTGKATYTDSIPATATTDNIDLWPVFESAHWLTFDANVSDSSATYTAAQRYTSDETTKAPTDPQRQGYTFGGWYTDQGCTEGNEFAFGSTLSENTTVYAKWTPAEANYTVIIWRQRVTDDKGAAEADKTYDYAESHTVTSTTGETVDSSDESKYTGYTTGDYKGFIYNHTNPDSITVAGDGSSVINVYYDRQLITMNFEYEGGYQYVYTETTEGYSRRTPQYGLVDGQYVQLYYSNYYNTWYYYSGYNRNDYTGTRYTRTETYVQGHTTTFTGLYGQPLSMYGYTWPSSDGPWYYKTGSSNTYMTFLGQFVLPGDQSSDGQSNTVINFHHEGTVGKNYYFYLQNADGSWPTTPTAQGSGATNAGNFNFSEKFDNFNVSAYQLNNDGTEENSDYGWTSTTSGQSVSVSDARSLGVRYTRKSYNVEFYNGNSYVNDADVSKLYEASLAGINTPTGLTYPGNSADASHYVFAGWFADPQLTTYVSFGTNLTEDEQNALKEKYPSIQSFVTYSTMPGHNLPVYAGWEPVRYTVTLDANGGSLPEGISSSYSVDYKDKITQVTPTRDGYEFLGWMLSTENGTPWNFDSGVEQNVTLVAHWRSTSAIKIAYDANVGSNAPTDDASYRDDAQATTKAAPTAPDGYEFVGWQLPDAKKTIVVPGEAFTIDADIAGKADSNNVRTITLTAVYTEIGTTYIRYDANGGTGTLTDVGNNDNLQCDIPFNSATALSSGDGFMRTGYVLVGWNTNKDANGSSTYADTRYQLGDTYGVNGEEGNTLYAEWAPIYVDVSFTKKGDALDHTSTATTNLAGAVFKMRQGGQDIDGATATSDSEGKVTFASVQAPVDGSALTVVETSAPTGYQTSNTAYTVSYDLGTATLGNDGKYHVTGTIANGEIVDKHTRTSVTLKKVDNSADPQALDGAQFTLLRYNDSTQKWENVTGVTGNLTVGIDGLNVTGLPDGTYQLTETKAPDGYVAVGDQPQFTISGGVVSEVSDSDSNGIMNVVDANNTKTITIKNTPGNPLPNTGGMGTMMYSAAGAALVLLSVALGFVLRRRNHGKGGC
jgi:uncharacterized repeat protein (TIGR02543 family)/LPXTG-motif cell wall-anchored protein